MIHDYILNHEASLRLTIFIAVFTAVAIAEIRFPKRPLQIKKSRRWLNNLSLVILNSLILRLLFPAAAVGAAIFAERQAWGIFNYLDWSPVLVIPLTLLTMDLLIYLQHVLFHAVPVLWRLHRVHHTDLDYDLTTGARFHPVEIILSMLIKITIIFALGPPAIAIIVFEIVLNAAAMFNHGNLSLPPRVDRILRWFIVTPDMHRVHHSAIIHETNSNFGFSVPWWDRLFGTYCAQPEKGHQAMTIGIDDLRRPEQVVRLSGLLKLPFSAPLKGGYTINGRRRKDRQANDRRS